MIKLIKPLALKWHEVNDCVDVVNELNASVGVDSLMNANVGVASLMNANVVVEVFLSSFLDDPMFDACV